MLLPPFVSLCLPPLWPISTVASDGLVAVVGATQEVKKDHLCQVSARECTAPARFWHILADYAWGDEPPPPSSSPPPFFRLNTRVAQELGANPHVLVIFVEVAVPHSALDKATDRESLGALPPM